VAVELVSRVIAARSPAVARNGAVLAGGLYILVGILPVFLGLAAAHLVPDLADAEQFLPALALEMLRAAAISEDKVKLTINHSTAANSLREEDVSRVLEYEVFWRIPHDLSVSSSTQLGQPIVIAKPYARVSRSIIDLSHALTGTRQEKRGFLDRFLGRSA